MSIYILGISAFYHDSAATIVVGGKVIAAVQEERFTREKHTPDFPINSIKYCLNEAGLELNDLDAIVFYDKPFLKFERIFETYLSFAPRGFKSFISSFPLWIKDKLFQKKNILDHDLLIEFGGGYGSMCRLIKNMGYEVFYIIYDLKHLNLIQEYFLSNIFAILEK